MSTKDTSGQETDGTDRQPATRNDLAAAGDEKTLKRARWEAFAFGPVAGEQRVNVVNRSYGDDASEHTYTVTIGADGRPTDCTCPAAEYQPGPCKHAVACADAPAVVAEAMHASERSESEESAGEARGTGRGERSEPEPADDVSAAFGADATTMADKLRADGRLVATDGGRERASFGALDSKDEVGDVDTCAKYLVPASDCIFSDGDGGCPHDVLTPDGGAVVSEQDDDTEACDRCGGTLGTPGDDAGEGLSYCSAYDAVCADCLLDHGPDECEHNDDEDDDLTCSECGETFESFLDCARHERPECPEVRDEPARPDAGAEPTRSEPADFGGGEGGIDEL